MIIRKIELKNFRQYTNTTLEFSTDSEKNVTLILGDNGTGKTTLAQAFQWVLYGKTSFQQKELLNRKVRESMTTGVSKAVVVSLEITYNKTDYTIKRKLTYKKEKNKIVEDGHAAFTISYKNQDGNQEYMPEGRRNYLLRRILPEDLSKFFFFDGEKIEEMSKKILEGKGDEFKEAVYGLVGLTAAQNTIRHLGGRLNKSERASNTNVITMIKKDIEKNTKSKAALEKYNKEIARLEEQIARNSKRKEELEQEIEKISKEIDEKNEIIRSETPQMQLKEECRKLEQRLEYENRKKSSYIKNEILATFSNGIYGFAMTPLMSKPAIHKMLDEYVPDDKVIPGLTKKTLDHLLQKGQCLCGTCLSMESPQYKAVEALLEYSYPKTIAMLKEEHLKMERHVMKEGEDYFENMRRKIEGFLEINARIEGLEGELAEKEDQLGNTEKGEQAKQRLKFLKPQLEIKKKDLINVCSNIKVDMTSRERQETEKEKLVIVDADTIRYQRYLTYAQKLYEKMCNEYANKETTYRIRLESCMNSIFEKIYAGNLRVEIDEKYCIFVNVEEGESFGDDLEKNTAQSYALIFAFISAVIELAKKKVNETAFEEEEKIDENKEGYPLVMDAPLSAFDITRIKNICTEIPRIADQVIMFIKDTDGNVAEEYMNDRIGMRYSVVKVNDSNLESEIVQEG